MVIQGVAGWQIRDLMTEQGIAARNVLLSPSRPLQVTWYARHPELFDAFRDSWYAERVAWFGHGFYALREHNGQTTIADLRMGEGDGYTFTFGLGTPQQPDARPQR